MSTSEAYFDIRAWRERLGWSQDQAAQHLGMSKRAFESLDRDETKRGVDLRTRLACQALELGWRDYSVRSLEMITIPMSNHLADPNLIEWVKDQTRNVSIVCVAGVDLNIAQPTTNVGLPLRDTLMRRGQLVLIEKDEHNWPFLFVNRDRIALMLAGGDHTTIVFASGSRVTANLPREKVIEILERP